MHVQIQLESPYTVWTNLDFIKGRVILQLSSTTSISSIIVKLEGESRTRLAVPSRNDPHDRPKPREEIHKVLYRTETVFPPSSPDTPVTTSGHFTLNPGAFEYPFCFKIPFNNSCHNTASATSTNRPQFFGREAIPPLTSHVKTTLPPTLTAFPGMAEVRYYLKVTVNRKEFYKENLRVHQLFNFLPIEPPRGPPSNAECFAARQHEFIAQSNGEPTSKKRGLFSLRKSSTGGSTSSLSDLLPKIRVDARLPVPAIITCNQSVPLRILVKKLNASTEALYLQSLRIQLNGLTHIRAHDVARDERGSWELLNLSDMDVLLRFPKNPVGEEGEELVLDPVAWRNSPLPNNLAPTFEACNISRKYVLEVHVGIGYGASSARNQATVTLTHNVQIYSGIEPPEALLEAMKKPVPSRKPVKKNSLVNDQPYSPVSPATPSSSAAIGTPTDSPYGPLPPGEVEPPPSYEDAIAADMPPVDGSQGRNYMPPVVPKGAAGFDMDGAGRNRRGS